MSETQDIERLKARYEALRDKKNKAEGLLESAQKELARLQLEAQERYGTSDLHVLKSKLSEMEAQNQRLQREYQAHLDEIDKRLKAVELEGQANG